MARGEETYDPDGHPDRNSDGQGTPRLGVTARITLLMTIRPVFAPFSRQCQDAPGWISRMRLCPVGHVASPVDAAARPVVDDKGTAAEAHAY